MRGYSIPCLDIDLVRNIDPFPPGTEFEVYEIKFTLDGQIEYWTHYRVWSDGTYTSIAGTYPPQGTYEFSADKPDHLHVELGMSARDLALYRFVMRHAEHGLPPEMRRMIMKRMCVEKRLFYFYKR